MSKQTKSIVSTTIVITILSMFFKVLGFVKQAVIAYYFGTNVDTSAYFVAFGFVGTLSSAFIRAITLSLVSIYTHTLVNKGRDAASKVISACLELLVPIVIIVTVLAYIFTPLISSLLSVGWTDSPEKIEQLQTYLRICYPFFLFAVVTLVWSSVMDANKDFVISRTESAITSIVTILCCVILSSMKGVDVLVIAQYASYICFGTLLLIRGRRHFKLSFVKFKDVPEIKTLLITALPLFIGSSVAQINKIVDNSLSTAISDDGPAALAFAVTLEEFVTFLLINNLVDVLYVNFSIYASSNDFDKLIDTMKKAINIMICIMLPITIVTCLTADSIVSIAFERGAFQDTSVSMVTASLIGYAIGFTSMGIRDIIIRGLYSFKDTKRPMITGIFAVAFNIFFSIVLSRHMGIMGITIASSISLTINFLINSKMLKSHIHDYSLLVHIPVLLKQIPAIIYTVAVVLTVKQFVHNNILIFMLSAIIGLAGYGVILLFMRIEEVDYIKEKVLSKLPTRK